MRFNSVISAFFILFNLNGFAFASDEPQFATVSIPKLEQYVTTIYQNENDAVRAAKNLVGEIERSVDNPLYSHASEDVARFFGRSNLDERIRKDLNMQKNLAILLGQTRDKIESNAAAQQIQKRAQIFSRRGTVLTVLAIFATGALLDLHPDEMSIDQKGWLGISLYLVGTTSSYYISKYIQKKNMGLELTINQKAALNQIEWLRENICPVFLAKSSVRYK